MASLMSHVECGFADRGTEKKECETVEAQGFNLDMRADASRPHRPQR